MRNLLRNVGIALICVVIVNGTNVISAAALEKQEVVSSVEVSDDKEKDVFEEELEDVTAIIEGKETIATECFGDAAYRLTYAINEDGKTITITGYLGSRSGDLIIPEIIDGYTVTGIGRNAFYESRKTSRFDGNLVLPDTLKNIGNGAFWECSDLTGDLIIPDSVKNIGDGAFACCSGFTGDLKIGNSVEKIGSEAFTECTGFKGKLTIGESVTSIGYNAFCPVSIYASVFTGDLIIPDSVESIGEGAFGQCRFTGDLIIPDSVKSIGNGAFSECSEFSGCLKIGNSVESIGDSAFNGCSRLTGSITIPNSVTSVGNSAFYGCSRITGDLIIPDTVTKIGTSVFEGTRLVRVINNSTEPVELPNRLEPKLTWKNELTGEKNITKITNGIAIIDANIEGTYLYKINADGETALIIGYYGDSSGDLVIPETIGGCAVTGINDKAFYNCGFTGNLIISNSVKKIGTFAFSNCDGFIGDLIIPDSVTTIDYGAFKGSGFTGSLKIGESVKIVGDYAFENCKKFTGSLILGNSVERIGNGAFNSCDGFMGSLIIPDTVTSIGTIAFNKCNSFTGNLTIGNGVTNIGSGAFDGTRFVRVINDSSAQLYLPERSGTTWKNEATGEKNITKISNGIAVIDANIEGKYLYTVNDDEKTVTIVGYNAIVSGDLVIPEKIKEYTVTGIGNKAFRGCGFTGSLTIPDTVTNIGDYAFSNCSGFTGTLTIPDTVTNIGAYAFCQCKGFTGSLTIPDTVTNIGEKAFYYCEGFDENLKIGKQVVTIGKSTFDGCSGFTGDLVIPDSVISIGDGAFILCKGFTGNLTIGDSVTSIGASAFSGCSGFTGDLIIPDSVISIGDGAFSDCSGFKGSLTIGNSVISIGQSAFRNCRNLTGNLVIPNPVTNIGDYSFYGCSSLNGSLTIGNSVEKIGNNAFTNCVFTGSLTIPDSVTSIGKLAFYGCRRFTGDLTILDSVISIEESAFSGCSGFKGSLTIPDTVTNISDYAFSNCSGFTGDLIIPDSVISIENGAFSGCSGFKGSLTIGNSVESIGYSAFHGCSGFTGDLIIPDLVKTIGDNAFYKCSGFEGDLIIPNSVTSIGNASFDQCLGLSRVRNNSSTQVILPKIIGKIWNNELTGEKNITTITQGIAIVEGGQPTYSLTYTVNEDGKTATITGYKDKASGDLTIPDVIDGYTVTSIGEEAFYYCEFTGNLIIPSSVKTIGKSAFYHCSGFTGNLTIPDTVTIIGDSAFSGCSGFTGNLTISDTVTIIGASAFDGCSGFTGDLVIPNSVTSIGASAFRGCSGFTGDLVIPDSVMFLGDRAFYNCGFTGNLSMGEGVTTIGDYAFSGCGFTGKLTIPEDVISIGESAFYSCNFTGDLTIPNLVTVIGKYAFGNCKSLSGSLTIGNSVTEIGDNAFYYCNGIKGDIVIPDKVKSIGYCAFYNCGLTGRLTIGKCVTSIGDYAFAYCSSLADELVIPDSVTNMGKDTFYGCVGLKLINNNSFAIVNLPYMEGLHWKNKETDEIITEISNGTAIRSDYGVTKYTVIFNMLNHGATIAPINNIESGSKIAEPTKPTEEGYTFEGWYKEEACINVWNFDVDTVNENITLYAKWTENKQEPPVEPIKYTVSFNTNGGTGTYADQILEEGNTVEKPETDPTKEGYTFKFWSCVNTDSAIEYDFNTVVTGDITLYAIFEENKQEPPVEPPVEPIKYTVSFNTNGGSGTYADQILEEGNTAEKPETDPIKEGYTFKFWSLVNTDSAIEYDFNTVVTGDITLYAIFEENKQEPPVEPDPNPEKYPFVAVFDETGTSDYSTEYDGLKKEPKVYVTNAFGDELTINDDYIVKYSNNLKATESTPKKATVTISGKGLYTGKTVLSFTITKKDISEDDVLSGYVEAKPKSVVKPLLSYKGYTLKASDYILKATDKKIPESLNPGELFTYTVEGKGNYKGYKELEIAVVSDLTANKIVVVQKTTKFTYNADSLNEDIMNSFAVYSQSDKEKKLPLNEGTDYIVSYPKCLEVDSTTNVGKYAVTITGINGFTGQVTKNINVAVDKGTEIAVEKIDDEIFKPTGVRLLSEEIIVTDKTNNVQLKHGVDYKVAYINNKAVSTEKKASVKIMFIGNYAGCKAITKEFVINKAPISSIKVHALDMSYTKPNMYKAPVYVEVGNENIAASEYTVKYYLTYDENDNSKCVPMDSKNKVTLADDETEKEVIAVISSKGKNLETGDVITMFKVKKALFDLSKLKVTVYDKTTYNAKTKSYKAVTAVEYTGEEIKLEDMPDYSKINDESETSRYYVSYEIQKKNSSGKAVWEKVNKEDLSFRNINNVKVGQMTTVITSDSTSYAGTKTVNIKIQAKQLKTFSTK